MKHNYSGLSLFQQINSYLPHLFKSQLKSVIISSFKHFHNISIYSVIIIPGGSRLPRRLSGKEFTCQCISDRRHRFNPWVGKIPWRRNWQPPLVFLPEKSHGQRSLAKYSPWGHKELDMTEANENPCILIQNCVFIFINESCISKSIFVVQKVCVFQCLVNHASLDSTKIISFHILAVSV